LSILVRLTLIKAQTPILQFVVNLNIQHPAQLFNMFAASRNQWSPSQSWQWRFGGPSLRWFARV